MQSAAVLQDFSSGVLRGQKVREISRRLSDLRGVFHDHNAYEGLDPATLVYSVELYQPVEEGVEGGLFWGSTLIEPGIVGDEYFFTKGHFHAVRDRAEYYVTAQGEGALVLMTEDRQTRAERMTPGTVHYIPGWTAHRVVNTGDTTLGFMACWPSDAGHDYGSIEQRGFGARVLKVDGKPHLVASR